MYLSSSVVQHKLAFSFPSTTSKKASPAVTLSDVEVCVCVLVFDKPVYDYCVYHNFCLTSFLLMIIPIVHLSSVVPQLSMSILLSSVFLIPAHWSHSGEGDRWFRGGCWHC